MQASADFLWGISLRLFYYFTSEWCSMIQFISFSFKSTILHRNRGFIFRNDYSTLIEPEQQKTCLNASAAHARPHKTQGRQHCVITMCILEDWLGLGVSLIGRISCPRWLTSGRGCWYDREDHWCMPACYWCFRPLQPWVAGNPLELALSLEGKGHTGSTFLAEDLVPESGSRSKAKKIEQLALLM